MTQKKRYKPAKVRDLRPERRYSTHIVAEDRDKWFVKLDPIFKADWVAALRSGKYKQGERWLKQVHEDEDTSYCCLGVACELDADVLAAGRNTYSTFALQFTFGNSWPSDKYYPNYDVVPLVVQYELANMNDEGMPFEMIAGFIQENL